MQRKDLIFFFVLENTRQSNQIDYSFEENESSKYWRFHGTLFLPIRNKKKLGTKIESVCFNFVDLWRRNEDSRDFSRNILKLKNLFRSISGFWERKIPIRVCSIRSQNSYRFLSRSFRSSKLEFGIPSGNF